MAGAGDYKVCPDCRVEYRLEALRCADCGTELVHRSALSHDDAPADFPPAAELECVRVAPIAWMRSLSQALQELGIAHRVEHATVEDAPDGQRPGVFGDVNLFGMYVEGEHAAVVRELDGSMAARLLPDEAPVLAEGEEDACPACGTALAADAVECPDCGLAFG